MDQYQMDEPAESHTLGREHGWPIKGTGQAAILAFGARLTSIAC